MLWPYDEQMLQKCDHMLTTCCQLWPYVTNHGRDQWWREHICLTDVAIMWLYVDKMLGVVTTFDPKWPYSSGRDSLLRDDCQEAEPAEARRAHPQRTRHCQATRHLQHQPGKTVILGLYSYERRGGDSEVGPLNFSRRRGRWRWFGSFSLLGKFSEFCEYKQDAHGYVGNWGHWFQIWGLIWPPKLFGGCSGLGGHHKGPY